MIRRLLIGGRRPTALVRSAAAAGSSSGGGISRRAGTAPSLVWGAGAGAGWGVGGGSSSGGGGSRGIHTWYSISTSGVTRGEDQISWDLVEAAAAERIARHTRPGKARVVLAGNERLPARKQRFSVIYEGIPRRKSLALSGSRPERIHFCDRIITDEFLAEEDCAKVVAACEAAVRSDAFITLSQKGEASFTPLQPVCEELVGTFAYRLLLSTLEKMRVEVQTDYHTPELFFAGALLSRLSPPPGLQPGQAPPPDNTAYYNAHIDKANKRAYDFSAIVYLNSQGGCTRPTTASAGSTGEACSGLQYGINNANGTDGSSSNEKGAAAAAGAEGGGLEGGGFLGGDFTFLDADVDRTISPLAGRMVSFTSGFENPHQVQPVTGGKRYALSVWFTTDPKDAYDAS